MGRRWGLNEQAKDRGHSFTGCCRRSWAVWSVPQLVGLLLGQLVLKGVLLQLQVLVTFEVVPVFFTMEPCVLLDAHQKALYRDVMQESYDTLMSLGKNNTSFRMRSFRVTQAPSSASAPGPSDIYFKRISPVTPGLWLGAALPSIPLPMKNTTRLLPAHAWGSLCDTSALIMCLHFGPYLGLPSHSGKACPLCTIVYCSSSTWLTENSFTWCVTLSPAMHSPCPLHLPKDLGCHAT